MNASFTLIFLTFVLTGVVALASPHEETEIIDAIEDTTDVSPRDAEKRLDEDNLILTRPKVDDQGKKVLYYYPYHQSLSPRFGGMIDFAESGTVNYSVGFNYMLPSRRSPHWEFGADVISNGLGHIHGGRRWIVNERTAFRPFYKLGLLHQVQSKNHMAGFLMYENYMIYGTAGIEYLFKSPMSFRLEAEAAVGTKMMALVTAGYSWAW